MDIFRLSLVRRRCKPVPANVVGCLLQITIEHMTPSSSIRFMRNVLAQALSPKWSEVVHDASLARTDEQLSTQFGLYLHIERCQTRQCSARSNGERTQGSCVASATTLHSWWGEDGGCLDALGHSITVALSIS